MSKTDQKPLSQQLGFLMESEDLKDFTRSKSRITLQELVNLKLEWQDTVTKLHTKIKSGKLTPVELRSCLNNIKAADVNLTAIKETIGVANGPIYGIIYDKSSRDSYDKMLNGLIDKNRSNKVILEVLQNEKKKNKQALAQYQATLNTYNATTAVEIDLYNVPSV